MASGWLKSLHCKSRAFEDVYHPSPKKHLMPSASCRKSSQSIKDVIETTTTTKRPTTRKSTPKHSKPAKPDPPTTIPTIRTRHSVSAPAARPACNPDAFFPALTELPEGHPSRNVVEIIFHSSWNLKTFPGQVEMIFKVQNGSKTVARFEEYREIVKSRARSGNCMDSATWRAVEEENARCAADGNEVMRFHCLGPATGAARGDYDGGGWAFPGCGKGAVICTFAESRGAHENAAGGGGGAGRGRRAMLVCRVIAGRVKIRVGFDELISDGRVGFDSVSGDNGELLVFDSRAVLPCFLIIYKL